MNMHADIEIVETVRTLMDRMVLFEHTDVEYIVCHNDR
jgi:hypothetical protein